MRQIPRLEHGREGSPRSFVDEQMKVQWMRAIKQDGLHHGYEGECRIVSGAHHGYVYRVAFHLENGKRHSHWRVLRRLPKIRGFIVISIGSSCSEASYLDGAR